MCFKYLNFENYNAAPHIDDNLKNSNIFANIANTILDEYNNNGYFSIAHIANTLKLLDLYNLK